MKFAILLTFVACVLSAPSPAPAQIELQITLPPTSQNLLKPPPLCLPQNTICEPYPATNECCDGFECTINYGVAKCMSCGWKGASCNPYMSNTCCPGFMCSLSDGGRCSDGSPFDD